MGQVSKYLRRTDRGYVHWCPGCKALHPVFDSWTFNGNVDNPTFSPSVKHEGMLTTKDENGKWTGDWVRYADGKPVPFVCHYFITNSVIQFCGDCTHSMNGQSIPLPELPLFYQDIKNEP